MKKLLILSFFFYILHFTSDIFSQWGSDVRLTNASGDSKTSLNNAWCIASSGSVVHAVWQDNRDGNNEIYYKRSTDAGVSWSADTRLTNANGTSESPSIAHGGSIINVVWQDNRDGNNEIYYKRSTDAGVSWSADTRLTNNANYSGVPCVTQWGSIVHVVWRDRRDGFSGEIYYKRSTDGGLNWSADTRLTNNTAYSEFPSIAHGGSNVHVVWHDNRDGNYEVYYKSSTDGGFSWSADTRLTSNNASLAFSSVAVSGSVVHVIWMDSRDGNWEIYYKRNPSGNPTEIKKISSEVPGEYKLYQNYPDPFNPVTTIKFDLSENSEVELRIYDILGREISLLINDFLEAGSYEYQWDAGKYPSGEYYYTLKTDKFYQTRKLSLVR